MKSQKLLIIGAIVCLLVGASGTAMARNDCPNGFIFGGNWKEIVIDEFKECVVTAATVEGGVQVVNANNFTMVASRVSGDVRIENTVGAVLVSNAIYSGNLVTKDNGFSIVYKNIVDNGNIEAIDTKNHQEVAVVENQVFNGSILVYGNKKADVKQNNVKVGNISCYENDSLDSFFNHTVFGTMDCKN